MLRVGLAVLGLVGLAAVARAGDESEELAELCAEASVSGGDPQLLALCAQAAGSAQKRKNEFVRFGKRKNEFVRFGKRMARKLCDPTSNPPLCSYYRFNKRAQKKDESKNEFVRFGRSAGLPEKKFGTKF